MVATSRLQGVAPLAVFFDATATTATSTPRAFHDLEYRWNFGDAGPSAGTWSVGARAGLSSKNLANGPLAAHVFETPGTYDVCITVTDGPNTADGRITITVLDPDVEFATSTLVVSADGDFTGAPAGDRVTDADFDNVINVRAANGAQYKRILFKRGNTFTASTFGHFTANGPGHVGAWGTGAKPLINGGSDKIVLGNSTNHSFGDWRFVDLDVGGSGSTGVNTTGAANRITFLRCTIRGHGSVMLAQFIALDQINQTSLLAPLWNEWALIDNEFRPIAGGGGLLIALARSAIMGNHNPVSGSLHTLRMIYANKLVVSNNHLTGASAGAALTVRGVAWEVADRFSGGGQTHGNAFVIPAHSFTEEVIVSDNRFSEGSSTQFFTFMAVDITYDVRFRNNIVERNWLITQGTSASSLVAEFSQSTVRNNLFDHVNAVPFGSFGVLLRGNAGATPPDNVVIYNNSLYSGNASAFPVAFASVSSTTNVVVRNNLGYAPNNTGGIPVNNPAGVVQSNNSTGAQINNGPDPFSTTPPTQPADWTPPTGSYAINGGGAVPVFSDFFANPRTGNHMGAVNP